MRINALLLSSSFAIYDSLSEKASAIIFALNLCRIRHGPSLWAKTLYLLVKMVTKRRWSDHKTVLVVCIHNRMTSFFFHAL